MYVYIKTRYFVEYLEYREDVNLKINDIVASAGVELVIPASSVDLHQATDVFSADK